MNDYECPCCGGVFLWNEKKETHVCDHCGLAWGDPKVIAAWMTAPDFEEKDKIRTSLNAED